MGKLHTVDPKRFADYALQLAQLIGRYITYMGGRPSTYEDHRSGRCLRRHHEQIYIAIHKHNYESYEHAEIALPGPTSVYIGVSSISGYTDWN